ncbi:hydrogenase [candidate division WOR-1 bacterium RIFOXYA12_FULL_43_27]|uniref:Hydrogenase n=1 Tax=candidate division WOR-1 bacterium RIFOXYC2_FULL_46_14 TaxID=1802587 RepID=A0A1F4U5J5_UNCSA|nr:MAG: hydrogenase [candidate division WOR-1 bacterium RIFOXYA12_FULL_43_27]OGC20356.1 MAG: hydrogenase [candidate division WOR-1 bacterium RIFOXYB2_FULL_46_45]OGC31907.1 MAG: hydrogenase [candidate division WOR-1 bacterium RIFOXYA2_FULL_46_56]OGC40202.1 MAG: hydrogenase [candidate division WOR-1 bacterium RIFOXYC2_FULL_46_14]
MIKSKIKNAKELAALYEENKAKFAEDKKEKILLCVGGGCIASGSLKIKEALQKELKTKGLDKKVALVETGCLGPCAAGPVMVISSDKTFYSNVKPKDVEEIVEKHLKKGKIVTRLAWRQHHEAKPVPVQTDIEFFKRQVKVVLRNCGLIDPTKLEHYIGRQGYAALAKVLTKMEPEDVLSEMKKSGLRGRGGAGFPTYLKWTFARDNRSDIKYILCNADEGDPGAFMDRSVLEGDPHSLIEGMAIGAFVIGARYGYVYVRAEYPLAVERLEIALDRARKAGLLGKNILGTDFSFDLEIKMGSGAFVCGEETALINSIEGKRGEPRPRPPFPAEKGLWQKPSSLNNVETFANVPEILLKGGDWFAQYGTEKSKGTKVFALAGAIVNAGLVEVPVGTTLGELIYDIGGGIPNGKQFKAAQIGGPSGGCIPKKHLNVKLDYESLNELGAIMGSGGLIVMDEGTCMVDVARYFLEFVQDESCGKCVPCREGTKRMLEIINKITRGEGELSDLDKLEKMGKEIISSSLCGLGQTAPNPVLSALRHFRHEFEDHILFKRCKCGVCPDLVRSPCQSKCPAKVDVPGYISLAKEGRFDEALKLHRDRNPFAWVCARVCVHPCETVCRRETVDNTAVSIRGLKRYMVENASEGLLPEVEENPENAKKKIAIIGAGPAGLSSAYFLARLGYKPEVFESEKIAGGMLVQTIPSYRLPRNELKKEIRLIEGMGVAIKTGKTFGKDFTLSSLRKDGYEAVFIAVGAPKGIAMEIPGADAEGVVDAMTFLREVSYKRKVNVGKKVVVVGGGNSAIDAARCALREKAEVTLVYRRTREEMPAYEEEVRAAVEEGMKILPLTNPSEIITKNDKVAGVKCDKMTLGEYDKSGRRRPEKSGQTIEIKADTVIFAIGQTLDCSKLVSEKDRVDVLWGSKFKTDKLYGQTGHPWLFAGGDCVNEEMTVIAAVADGEKAAVGIDKYLTGEEHAFWRIEKINTSYFNPDADPVSYPRKNLPELPASARKNNFDPVERSFNDTDGVKQCERCLRCDFGK